MVFVNGVRDRELWEVFIGLRNTGGGGIWEGENVVKSLSLTQQPPSTDQIINFYSHFNPNNKI